MPILPGTVFLSTNGGLLEGDLTGDVLAFSVETLTGGDYRTIYGTIDGDNGDDTIYGLTADVPNGVQVVYGGGGDDQIGFDHLADAQADFGSGLVTNPYYNPDGLFSTNVNIDGGSGSDLIFASLLADTLNGGEDEDIVMGYLGADSIFGGTGSDCLFGFYGSIPGTEIVDLSGDQWSSIYPEADGGDTIDGGKGDDYISGGDGNDSLLGGANQDLVEGDDDCIFGGQGNDTIQGNGKDENLDGDDLLVGGFGADSILGNQGDDCIFGFGSVPFQPDFSDDELSNTLHGGAGNDCIWGGGKADLIFGGLGYNDTVNLGDTDNNPVTPDEIITVGLGGDLIYGDHGDDTIYGDSTNNNLLDGYDCIGGGSGNDNISGGYGDDCIYGQDGNDTIFGNNATNNLLTHDDDDCISGGYGHDSIQGGFGYDCIVGDWGNDTILGNQDNDELYGDNGYDSIHGGSGNDCISGGTHGDSLYGGVGSDCICGNYGRDLIYGNEDGDLIDGGVDADTIYGGQGNDCLYGYEHRDSIFGGTGDDIIDGGTENDFLYGNEGADCIYGGGNNDYIVAGRSSGITTGAEAIDTLGNWIDGGEGKDKVMGADGDDDIYGGAGVNVTPTPDWDEGVHIANTPEDTLVGRAGNDLIVGGTTYYNGDNWDDGSDTLSGGAGNDVLIGDNWNYTTTPSGPDDFPDSFSQDSRDYFHFTQGTSTQDILNGPDNTDWIDDFVAGSSANSDKISLAVGLGKVFAGLTFSKPKLDTVTGLPVAGTGTQVTVGGGSIALSGAGVFSYDQVYNKIINSGALSTWTASTNGTLQVVNVDISGLTTHAGDYILINNGTAGADKGDLLIRLSDSAGQYTIAGTDIVFSGDAILGGVSVI